MDNESLQPIARSEHIKDAGAKRVAPVYLNPDDGDYYNLVPAKVPGVDFDYLSIVNSDTDQDTLTFKLGGSGGTTIQTIVIDYAAGAAKASDDLSALTWS